MEFIAISGCLFMVVLPILFIVSLILAIARNSKGWTVATIIIGVFGLIAVVGMLVFAGKEGGSLIEKLNEPRVFTSTDGLVEVTAPGTWRVQDLENDLANLEIGNLFSEQYLLLISEDKREFAPEFSLRDYAEVISEQMLEVVEDPYDRPLVSMETGEYPSFEWELDGGIDGLDIAYLIFFIEGEEAFHQILTWTLLERKEKHFPVFREVIGSFREISSAGE
ncbi:MAG: hypothetical protein AAGF67_04405 [Verrucomicrobiota bacterium]